MRVHTFYRSIRRAQVWLLVCLLCLPPGSSARADEPVWASGQVIDGSGRPVPGALVAVYDDSNRVVDYARTDRDGEYALAVPRQALHLNHHGRGFFAEVFGSVARFVNSTVGFVANPLRAGVRAVTSSEAANFADPLTKGEIAVGGAVVDQTLFAVSPKPRVPKAIEERKKPGALLIKVIAPDHNDLVSVAHIYWIEDELLRNGNREKRTTATWIDPVQLTEYDTDHPSHVQTNYLSFTASRLEPSVAEAGQVVRIYTVMPGPPTPDVHVVVVARNDRTGEKWQLQSLGNGRYATEFKVDRRFPRDDQAISLIAYGELEQKPGRRRDAESAIEEAGLWNPRKPFVYDPLLVASRNRADLTLTVVASQKIH